MILDFLQGRSEPPRNELLVVRFRHEVLASIGLGGMISKGPSIVQEVLLACHRKGYRIEEIPIIFEERRSGRSTLNTRIILESLIMMWRLARRSQG